MDHGRGDTGFDRLDCELSYTQRGTDQGFVAEHRRFDERTLAVAHRPLPTPPPFLLDHVNMSVPRAGCRVCPRTGYSGGPRRNDHDRRRVRLTSGNRLIDRLGVLGTIGHHGEQWALNLLQPGADHRQVAHFLGRQLRGEDFAAIGIHRQRLPYSDILNILRIGPYQRRKNRSGLHSMADRAAPPQKF